MKSILKQFLPLIIGLFIIITIIVVLLFVFVDCEKEEKEPMLNVTLEIYVFNGGDKIAEYILNKENDYYLEATLPYDGIKKNFAGRLYLEDGTYFETSVMTGISGYSKPDGTPVRSYTVQERGDYLISIGCSPEPEGGKFPQGTKIRLIIE